jgi:protein-S-isoprenylcysteine O-methyltransferase Ste14
MRSLATRVTVHAIAPVVLFAAVLCASAGTLSYWQAWAYAGFHLSVMLATNAYFLRVDPSILERRLRLPEKGEGEPAQKARIAAIALSTLAMLVVAGLDRRNGWSHVPAAAIALAFAANAVGSILLFLVMRENRFAGSTIGVDADQHVVTTGPYRLVRHPMYAGFALIGVTTPLALGSFWAELLVGPLLAAIVARLLHEERLLAERLDGYAQYMKVTRARLVPGAW